MGVYANLTGCVFAFIFSMKPVKTKAQIRAEIAAQTDAFIHNGGEVNNVPMGASGREAGAGRAANFSFDRQAQPRTQVQDVIQAIEARRQARANRAQAPKKAKRPRKQIIYDDFGQPLRWQWVED